jgi:SAM-dependent methyltransferase
LVSQVLTQAQRIKLDSDDDAVFYRDPRFVHHLDAGFRQRLTQLYRERLHPSATLLDLMSSWVSHLPDDIRYERVIGHGLNGQELAANPRLDSHWMQNLNLEQTLPLPDNFIDTSLIVAGWQYLQYPEAVAAELLRITRPGGQVIVSFSNRMFFTKAPQIWTEADDRGHLDYVCDVLTAQGWSDPIRIAEETKATGMMGLLGGQGDPFLSVTASKQ